MRKYISSILIRRLKTHNKGASPGQYKEKYIADAALLFASKYATNEWHLPLSKIPNKRSNIKSTTKDSDAEPNPKSGQYNTVPVARLFTSTREEYILHGAMANRLSTAMLTIYITFYIDIDIFSRRMWFNN